MNKNITSFDNLWSLCYIEKYKLMEKVLKVKMTQTCVERKGKFGTQTRHNSIAKIQCYGKIMERNSYH